jgi:metallo-beta-lactamase class B
MSEQSAYEAYLQRREAIYTDYYSEIWLNPEKRYVSPFRLYGNVWYVGDAWVCVHLIDTGDGLLLIDSGTVGQEKLLVNAIWEAGFKPCDVKWIIHSHGHLDHIGAANFFKRLYGTTLYLGAPDAEMFRTRPWLSAVQNGYNDCAELFEPDVEINEGDVLRFGNTEIECRLVPGHTDGCVALFFDAFDGAETKRCGYYGGFGFNTLTKEALLEKGDTEFRTRRVYLQSLASVRDQHVDVFLGNHCSNNNTIGRRKMQLDDPEGPNPFVDETLWGRYLDQKREEMLRFMADPANN